MALEKPPVCDFGWTAPTFELPGTDGKTHALETLRGPQGTLLIFICNHCPYVLAVVDRIVRDAKDLQSLGVGVAAICSNDAEAYPADSFDNMARFATEHGFTFPYLHDESQEVARAYGAACTPDFFGFNADLALQYRGRLDASRAEPATGARRDLYEAMSEVAETGRGPAQQIPSMGCSIKWKDTA
ncbi:thioredoxin family protein [Mesobaculum littorinae]|uniref:Thioredoxin family protein n=1 Tax=Mesobaculum littorinae TaxID=2486419 RepID=A0A438AL00_9RHOB|nr:thioredoxin family protein [Mesobaculum littorinae]RVV99247.1 thioredoxin family protein [Mesobaculum littorinae]